VRGPNARWSAGLARYRHFAWQLGALLGLEQAYEFTRGRIAPSPDVAILNSYRLLDLEWRHGLFVEQRVERFFLQFGPLMNAVDLFYVFGHLLVTLGVLVWIYIRRRNQYPFVRNLIMLTTGVALVVFYLFPAAPPRMLGNYGFVDPLQLHHLVGEGGAQPGSYTYNPYAAMPSLHVGYALVVAWGVFISERRRWVRAPALLYPILMAATVIISGNHWILDVVGAVITVGLSGCILLLFGRLQAAVASRIAPTGPFTGAPAP
jgi:membrane-associated phospholipid phosphatase